MLLRKTLLAMAFLSVTTAVAADWPGFRGPNRDGISTETGLLKEWPEGGPKVVWTAKNLGLGWSTPSVADGRIYGMGRRDGKDGVWALKQGDGTELWFTPVADFPKVAGPTNGPGSTPTFHDGKVFAVTTNGTLACLDAKSGKKEWTKSYLDDFGGSVPTWGYTGSVLVDGDKLICTPGGQAAAVVALKPSNGEVIWKSDVGRVGGAHGYSSPLKMTVKDVPMYVALMGDASGVVGVHADSGKLLWQYKARPATGSTAQIPIPIVKDDHVWVSSGYGGGSALLQIVPKGKDGFEAKELKAFRADALKNHHGGMVLVDGHIYMGHGQNQGNPACVEFKTGEIKWGPEKNPAKGNGSAAVVYADNRLYFRYENGMMVLIEPNPEELKVVSSFKLPQADQRQASQSWPHPVIVDGKLLIRDQTVMHCYDIRANSKKR